MGSAGPRSAVCIFRSQMTQMISERLNPQASENKGNPDDHIALQQFEETTIFNDGCYQVALPWREDHPVLHDNYDIATKRLDGLRRKFKKDDLLQ